MSTFEYVTIHFRFLFKGIPSDLKQKAADWLLGTVLVFAFLSEWGGCRLTPASFILQYNFKDITAQGRLEGVMYHYGEHHTFPSEAGEMPHISLQKLKCHNAVYLLNNIWSIMCEYKGECQCPLFNRHWRVGAIRLHQSHTDLSLNIFTHFFLLLSRSFGINAVLEPASSGQWMFGPHTKIMSVKS